MGPLENLEKTVSWHERKSCALCESNSFDKVMELAPTPLANDFVKNPMVTQQKVPLTLLLCQVCGHVQLKEIVNPEELFANYVYVSGTSSSFVRHFEEYAQECTERFKPIENDLIVDIGSNDGTLLHAWKNLGAENVLGIEPAKNIAQEARSSGIDTIEGYFDLNMAKKLREERGPAKIITANNVFAHAENLKEFIEAVSVLLAPEGAFVFEVSYLASVVKDLLFDTIYHEHTSYHALAPLVSAFEKAGLHVFDAEEIKTHGGSLRVYVTPEKRPKYSSVEIILGQEKAIGLDKKFTFVDLKEKIRQKATALRSAILKIKKKGEKIAGYGAPAKLTTLMHEMAMSPFDIEYIVDDSAWKQGLFTPGYHIPVLPVSALYEEQTDTGFRPIQLIYGGKAGTKVGRCKYTIIFAWNFWREIMNTHQNYIKTGGTFLSPFGGVPFKFSPFEEKK